MSARAYWAPHVTVACIIERDQRFLMVEEVIEGNKLALNQAAGHLDPGESLQAAAIRECREETGYLFKPAALVGVYHWQKRTQEAEFLRFCFCGQAEEIQPKPPLDDGIIRARWLSLSELEAQAHVLRGPTVLQCIRDYLAGQRYPLELLTHLRSTEA